MRNLPIRSVLLGVALLTLGTAALAQAPTPLRGTLKSIGATEAVVTTTQGDVSVTLPAGWQTLVIAKTSVEAIKDGSFIGTTNVDDGAGGRSTEVHVFPPGVKLGEGQRVMDATTGTKMTNGTVGKVVKSEGGPQFDVSFPGGVRHVTVPKDAIITTMTPVGQDYVKTGMAVNIVAIKGPDGKFQGRFVTTGPNGSPPPR